jgi:hypothetical protein
LTGMVQIVAAAGQTRAANAAALKWQRRRHSSKDHVIHAGNS